MRPNGTKAWRFDYRFSGKRKTLAVGLYPSVKLSKARESVVLAKGELQENLDPTREKQRREREAENANLSNLFPDVARQWWEHNHKTWKPDHAARVWKRIEDNAIPELKYTPIADVNRRAVTAIGKAVERRGASDVASRVMQDIRRILSFAEDNDLLEFNPVGKLTGVLKARKTQHRPSLSRSELPEFLRDLEAYPERGRLITYLAVKLLVLTFVRSGELRGAKWSEFDFEGRVWRVPGERMKMKVDHLVPLTDQAIAILEQLRPITGSYDLLLPSERSRAKPMSDNTMRRAIFKLGYDGLTEGKSKCVPHGFRATASSILNETGFNADAIERQLAHRERNAVRAAYIHHAQYLEERTQMMQWWADYLDQSREDKNVLAFVKRA